MKQAATVFWTIIAVILIALVGNLITQDRYVTGTYLQFETSRSLVIPAQVTLGASSEDTLYLYRLDSKDTISGVPSGEPDNITFVYEPSSVNPGKWVNPTINSVKYTISSDQPVKITLVDSEPGFTWFITIIVGIIVYLLVLLAIL